MHVSWLRFAIALAMALMLPLQGVAAATAGLCAAYEHHQHGAVDGHAAHSDGGGDHQHHGRGHHKSHCGSCLACCAPVAMVAAQAVAVPVQFASAPRAVPSAAPGRLQPDTPFRPPLAG